MISTARRQIGFIAVAILAMGALGFGAAPASAFRYFESEITEVPGSAPVPGTFGGASEVAVDGSGNVWVLDGGKQVIDKFDPTGNFVAQGTGEGGWFPGGGITGLDFDDATGLMYVSDNTHGDLWKLNPVGVVQGSIPGSLTEWASPKDFDCCNISVDVDNTGGPGDGNFYVSAQAAIYSPYQGVYRIDASGKPVNFTTAEDYVVGNHILGLAGNFETYETYINTAGVAPAANGDLWLGVTGGDFYIQPGFYKFDITGAYTHVRGEFPPPSFPAGLGLSDIVIDPTNGHIIVAAAPYVFEYKADGTFLEALTAPSGFNGPSGLAVDSAGTLYVADGNSVKVFGKDFPTPTIAYHPVTDVEQTSVTLNATIDPNGGGPVTSCVLEYGTDTSYGSTAPCSPDPGSSPPGSNFTGTTDVSASVSGLTPEQPYHYRFALANANASRKGADQTVIPHWVKGVDTTAATELSPNTAKLNAAFIGNGAETTFHFEWGKDESYGFATPERPAGAPVGEAGMQTVLAGLDAVTTYHYRVVATNPDGTSIGDDEVFTTTPFPPALEEWITDVHSDSALFHARINPGGGETTYSVEYVEDGVFQESGFATAASTDPAEAGSGKTFKELTTNVVGLAPGTTYHYRIVASNSYKSVSGPERTLTTFEYGGSLVDPCPNAQVRQLTSAALLKDCRAFELVSAANTSGYDVESQIVPGQTPFSGYPDADGRVLYGIHHGSVPGDWNPTNLGLDPYVATRTGSGWVTDYVGFEADGTPSSKPFASSLGGADSGLRTFAFGGEDLCAPCFNDGKTGIPVRMPDGTISQGMAGSMDPGATAKAGVLTRKRLSDDGSRLVFGSTDKFESDAASPDPSIYVRDLQTAATTVVSKLPNGDNIPCLSNCASNGVAALDISADGSRVLVGQLISTDAEGNHYWHLYMNVGVSAAGIDLMPGSTSGALYDGMSADGTEVYFTSNDKLAGDADESADIYRAEVGNSSAGLTRVSTGTEGTGDTDGCDPGLNNVRRRWNAVGDDPSCDAVAIGGGGGVSSASGDIYFLSPELLDGASNGTADAPNLYLARVGSAPHYVTTLESSLAGPQPTPTEHPFVRSFGTLTGPSGVALDPGGEFVYVMEPGEGFGTPGYVYKFDAKGHPVNFTAGKEAGGNKLTGEETPPGAFLEVGFIGLPSQLAVDQTTGDFLVPNLVGGEIDRFSSSGEYLSRIEAPFFPAGVAVDQTNGNVYVSSFFGLVFVFDSSGAPISTFPVIEGPKSVAVDSSGNFYVANGSEAAVYDSSGAHVRNLPGEAPEGISVDPNDDHVYVVEGSRIVEFDSSGAVVGIPIGVNELSKSVAASVDEGLVVASNTAKGTISVFGHPKVVPNPIYDNPVVLNAIGDAETRHTADFQTTSTGDFAVFSTKLPLTAYDNDLRVEVYRYAAVADGIDCVSCPPTGARATTDASLAPNGLSVSEDGAVFFNSSDPLLPSDLNDSEDAFEWKGGKLGPISSGTNPIDSSLLSISADGRDAFFFTRESLAPQDENGNSVKLYDARVEGGFVYTPPSHPCVASDECHGPGTQIAPPPDIGTFQGSGGNLRTAKPKCRKGLVRKGAKCVKKKRSRKHSGRRR